MASLPLDPIFAHLLLKSQELGYAFHLKRFSDFLFPLTHFSFYHFNISNIFNIFIIHCYFFSCLKNLYVQNDGYCEGHNIFAVIFICKNSFLYFLIEAYFLVLCHNLMLNYLNPLIKLFDIKRI